MKRLFIVFLFIFLLHTGNTEASQIDLEEQTEESAIEEYLSIFDFSSVQEKIDEALSDTEEADFKELVKNIIYKGVKNNGISFMNIMKLIFNEFTINKNTIVNILIIAVLCALMTNLLEIFGSGQVSEMGFWVSYMCLLLFLMSSFEISFQMVHTLLSSVTDFVRALIPAYMLSISLSHGQTTTALYYEILLFVVQIVEYVIINIFLPLVYVYFILQLFNGLSEKPMLKRLAKLFKLLLDWGLKSIFAAVFGYQLLQTLLVPYVDKIKGNLFQKMVKALPGIGQTWSVYSEVLLSSGVLIKNAIGVAAIIIILVILLYPIIKLGVITVLYLITASLVEPFSNERIIKGIESLFEANRLLLKLCLFGAFLFIITIALICGTVNLG